MGFITGVLGVVHQIDVQVYTFFNGTAGNWLADHLVAEEEGNQLLKGGLFLAFYWYAWFRRSVAETRRRRQIVSGLTATLGALVTARILATTLPFRVRPMFEAGLPHRSFTVPMHPNMEAWSAFPSDTATTFFALAIAMTYVERTIGRWLLLVAATWISIPRLYIGLHYLTDILGGVLVAGLITRLIMRSEWIDQRIAAPLVKAADAHTGVFYAVGFLLTMEMATLFDSTRALMHSALRAWRMAPHHDQVTILWAAGLMAIVVLVGAYAWRRRSWGRRTTAAAI